MSGKAQRGAGPCPRLHSKTDADLGWNPDLAGSRDLAPRPPFDVRALFLFLLTYNILINTTGPFHLTARQGFRAALTLIKAEKPSSRKSLERRQCFPGSTYKLMGQSCPILSIVAAALTENEAELGW